MAKPNFAQSGPIDQGRFAIADPSDTSKQIQFNATPLESEKQVVLQADAANDGVFTLPPQASGALSVPGGNTLQYEAPEEAGTVTISSVSSAVIVEPATALTTLTVSLPSSLPDGQNINLCFAASVANLIVTTASATIVGAPTASGSNGTLAFLYRLANTTYYRSL